MIIIRDESPSTSVYSVTDILHQQQQQDQPLLYSGYTQNSDELYRTQVNVKIIDVTSKMCNIYNLYIILYMT